MNRPDFQLLEDDVGRSTEVPPTIPAFSVRGALSPLLLVPMSIPVLVALFAPHDILDMWPWARRFTQWVQNLLPYVNMSAHANSTEFPQVAMLAHSCTVTVIPAMALVWLWQSMVNYPRLLARRRALGRITLKQFAMTTLVGPLVFLGALYAFIALPGDPSWGHNLTTQSRAGFAFMTLLAVYLTSVVLGVQALMVRLFVDQYTRRAPPGAPGGVPRRRRTR